MSRTRLIVLRRGLALELPQRSSAAEVPRDAHLRVGEHRINLDQLPPPLARLLPPAFAHAPAEAFEPLLRAMGLERRG